MKKGVKKLIVSLIAVVMFAYVGVSVLAEKAPVNAVTVNFTSTSVNDTYDVSETATFPASIDVNYNGTTKTAGDGILVYPSGKIVTISNKVFEFTEQGAYVLRYFFMDGSVKVTAEKTFTVGSSLYHLTSTSGSITPVTAAMNLASDFKLLSDDTMSSEREGLIVRLSEGCEFKYNKPVNLADVGEDGLSNIITLDPRVYDITGLNEAGNQYVNSGAIVSFVKVKLTDCYNPNRYIELVLNASNVVYLRVSSNSQTDMGILYPSDTAVSSKVKEYYVGNIRGAARVGSGGQWNHGYSAATIGTNAKPFNPLSFKYDYDEAKIYVYGGAKLEEDAVLVNDLLSPELYGENLFQGFTTGEVNVSIKCETYNKAKAARIDVLGIGNDKGDYLLDAYNDGTDYTRYADDVAPVIKLDGISTDKVYCAVGDTFKIPSAVAYDVNLVGGIETRVYRNYDSEKKASVSISNNAFSVNAVDTYYIEYSAVDKFGNRGTKVFKVYGVQTEKGKSLYVNTDKLASLQAGAVTSLPVFDVVAVNDPASVELVITATCEGKETIKVATLKGLDAINEAGANGITFMPKYAGSYTISYALKDNVFDLTGEPFEYTVNCTASNNVSFLNAPFLERYIMKNATYGLREFTAFEFSSGAPAAKPVSAYISFDNGAFELINDTNNVLITGDKTVQIKYAIDENNYVLSDVVDIVDVNYSYYDINLRKYFVYEDGAFTVEELGADGYDKTDIEYIATATTGNSTLSFVNSVFAKKFSFEYKVGKKYADFEKINIILTDVQDPTCKTVITLGKNLAKSYISVNDGMKYSVDRAFATDTFNVLAYDGVTKKLTLDNATIITDINAPSEKVYVDVEIYNAYGVNGIAVRAINNQRLFGDLHEDLTNPEVLISKATGQHEANTLLTIVAPQYSDVLSPIDLTTVKYSVKFGDEVMRTVDGVLLDGVNNSAFEDAVIRLDRIGEYSVQYSACDMMGNQMSGKYFFSAIDTVVPNIVVSGFEEGYVYTIGLGEKLTVNYEISDNVTPNEECHVAVMVTNMTSYDTSLYTRSDMEGFTLGEATFYIIEEGLHRVTVYCRDGFGNITTKEFNVMVKA